MVLYLGLYNKVGSWNKTWRVALSGVTLFEGGPVLARAEVHPPGLRVRVLGRKGRPECPRWGMWQDRQQSAPQELGGRSTGSLQGKKISGIQSERC